MCCVGLFQCKNKGSLLRVLRALQEREIDAEHDSQETIQTEYIVSY